MWLSLVFFLTLLAWLIYQLIARERRRRRAAERARPNVDLRRPPD
jgi:hypothetical protein